jgi:hypothetical protein
MLGRALRGLCGHRVELLVPPSIPCSEPPPGAPDAALTASELQSEDGTSVQEIRFRFLSHNR